MPPEYRTAGGSGSRLFLVYAAISLVPIAALGAVLMRGYDREAVEDGLRHGKAEAAVIEAMAIAPALREADLSQGLTVAQRQRLQDATELAIYNGSVVRLRIYGLDARVVFADDGSGAGARPTDEGAFARASAGRTDARIVAHPDGGGDDVIRVFQPIFAHASGRSTGVLEIHLPYRAIADGVKVKTRNTYQRLAVGLGALYLVLAVIAWSTTRALRLHAARREHESLHDPLTGLANRQLFRQRAAEAVQRAGRGECGAIVLVDLDHFKDINDTLGHHAGDQLLRVLSQRLADSLRTDDTVARLGGDEFGLVLPRITSEDLVRELLMKVYQRMSEEFMLGSVPLTVEGSFGVALYPAHGDNVETLLQHADAAMYHAKRGRSAIAVYRADETPQAGHRLLLQSELRHALERDELVLHYQPKVDLVTGQVVGLEALARWAHPTRGLVAPGHFLPTVEQSGLIGPFTDWVLRRALHDQAAWSALGADWPVAVNVSARNLESAEFPGMIARLLSDLGVNADRLHVEITETAVAADAKAAVNSVLALAEHGIAVAIDDFGTGYTSLSQLRRLPITELKIDRAFVAGVGRDQQDQAIVRSVIELAHGIGARVTAEGVENTSERDWLAQAGCDVAQGYLFAKPMPWTQVVQEYGDVSTATPQARSHRKETRP